MTCCWGSCPGLCNLTWSSFHPHAKLVSSLGNISTSDKNVFGSTNPHRVAPHHTKRLICIWCQTSEISVFSRNGYPRPPCSVQRKALVAPSHSTDSHSIKYLTDNEKGFESRKSIAASPQWFASPTEMAHLQAPFKILSATDAHWTGSHHQQWQSAASWLYANKQ